MANIFSCFICNLRRNEKFLVAVVVQDDNSKGSCFSEQKYNHGVGGFLKVGDVLFLFGGEKVESYNTYHVTSES